MKQLKSLALILAAFSTQTVRSVEPKPIELARPVGQELDTYSAADRGGPTNLTPGFVGETYMGIGVTQIITNDKCEVLVQSMKEKLIDAKFQTKEFVYDYVFHCEEMAKGIKILLASLIVEPKGDSEVEALKAFVTRVKGEVISGLSMTFAQLKGIEIEKRIAGIFVPTLSSPPIHRFELVSTKIESFANLHQFRMHLLVEKTHLYYAQNLLELTGYLKTYLHPNEMAIFEEKALKKSNVVIINNSRRNVLMSNDKLEGLTKDTNYSLCQNFDTKYCMME